MIKIGFLGCSKFVRVQHLQNAHFSQHCQVHTLCDIDEKILAQTQQQFPALRTTTRVEELLADPDINLVVIAMLPSLHAQMTKMAIAAGKHVLVEKPMAETEDDCRQIVKMARERGVQVAVGFNRRFAPAVRQIQNTLKGRRGPVILEYTVQNDSFWRIGTHWVDRNGLLDEIVHIFDLTTHLIGCNPVRLFATDSGLNNNIIVLEYADRSSVMINANENGTSAAPKEMMRLTCDGHFIQMKDYVEVDDVTMEKTAVRYFAGRKYSGTGKKYDDMVDWFMVEGFESYKKIRENLIRLLHAERTGKLTERERNDLIQNPLPPLNYMVDKGWAASLDHLAECLMAHRPPENADGRDGIRATYLANKAIESASNHQVVTLDANVWENV
jgi:predicted dehydrogenase